MQTPFVLHRKDLLPHATSFFQLLEVDKYIGRSAAAVVAIEKGDVSVAAVEKDDTVVGAVENDDADDVETDGVTVTGFSE